MLLIGKSRKGASLVAIVLFDTTVHSKSTTIKFAKSMLVADLVQSSRQFSINISKGFFSETTGPI